MTIPTKFPIYQRGAVASYDFTDIDEGSGVVEYSGVKVSPSNSTFAYHLTTNDNMYSADNGGTACNGADIDFDVLFNLPKLVKGNIFVQIPVKLFSSSGTHAAVVTATVVKWNGVSETAVAATVTSPALNSTAGSQTVQIAVLKLPVSTLTLFKAGETLRVTITGSTSGGTGGTAYILHSPAGGQYADLSTGASGITGLATTRLSAFVPFIIQLDNG